MTRTSGAMPAFNRWQLALADITALAAHYHTPEPVCIDDIRPMILDALQCCPGMTHHEICKMIKIKKIYNILQQMVKDKAIYREGCRGDFIYFLEV